MTAVYICLQYIHFMQSQRTYDIYPYHQGATRCNQQPERHRSCFRSPAKDIFDRTVLANEAHSGGESAGDTVYSLTLTLTLQSSLRRYHVDIHSGHFDREHVGIAFPLLKCLRTHYGRHCEPFSGQKCTEFIFSRVILCRNAPILVSVFSLFLENRKDGDSYKSSRR